MAKAEKAKANDPRRDQSIEARAWNNTKLEGDPDYELIPDVEFKGKLQFAAERAQATGTAQTNFEQEVLKLQQEDLKNKKSEGPLAISAPNAALSSGPKAGPQAPAQSLDAAGGPAADSNKKAKATTKKSTTKKASKSKSKPAAPDTSGKLPTGKEKASAAREEAKAPIHP